MNYFKKKFESHSYRIHLASFILFAVFIFLFSHCRDERAYLTENTKDIFIAIDSLSVQLKSPNLTEETFRLIELQYRNRKVKLTPEIELFAKNASKFQLEDIAVKYARILQNRACPQSYFSQSAFQNLSGSKVWEEFIQDYEKKDNPNEKRLELRAKIQEIYYKDQLIASSFSNANIHPLYNTITDKFLNFVNTYGFPSDELVGVKMKNDTIIETPYYYVIMLHHYHKGDLILWEQLDEYSLSGALDYRYARSFKNYEIEPEIAEKINAKRVFKPKNQSKSVFIATDYNQPVCTEKYLFKKIKKEEITVDYNTFQLVYLDWNSDGIFREKNTDYYAIQFPDDSKTCYYTIGLRDTLRIDDNIYQIDHLNQETRKLDPMVFQNKLDPKSFRLSLKDLPLENNASVSLTNLSLDTTIVYFYASWCAPCIKKLVQIEKMKCELKVNFFPVALDSSPETIKRLFSKNNLSFPVYLGNPNLMESIGIQSFPYTITLDKKNRIARKTVNLSLNSLFNLSKCI